MLDDRDTTLPPAPLLGRDRELAVLGAAVAAASGEGAALLVVGDAGIGKSALLSSARNAAQGLGYLVLEAAGVESESHLPFGGIHEALGRAMGQLECLPDPQRMALATAFGMEAGTHPDLFLIAEAALALVAAERRHRPVAIFIDDLQWLDPQSHQILTFLAHRGVGAGLSVVGAMRADHSGPFAQAGFPQLEVHGLDDDSASLILGAHAATLTTADRTRIHEQAQGNPLALLELPRSWVAGASLDSGHVAVSARLEQAFAGRISELPGDTRDALLVAAVSSSNRIDEIARAVKALGTPGPSREHLGPAVAAGLITEDGVHVGFRHPLVRSGVLQRESLARRHAAHAALADTVDQDRYRQAWHRAWSIVGPDDAVADALTATVPDSLRRGAVMSAVASLERAAQLTSSSSLRGRRLMKAADRAFEAGRADVVHRLLSEASSLDLDDLDETRVRWLAEALNEDVRADPVLVRQLCDGATRAAALGDVGLALNLLLAAALRCWWTGGEAADRVRVVQVLEGLPDANRDSRYLATLAVAEPVLRGSDVMRSLRAAALSSVTDGDSLRMYGQAAYAAGDFVLATDLLDRAEASFRQDGRLGMLPMVLALQLQIRLHLGDWSGAELAGQEVVTVSKETGQAIFAENNVLVEARGMALRGQWQPALAMMAQAEADAARSGVNDRICLAYQARGTALLSADKPADAFECLRRQYDPADPGYHLRESFAGLALTAEAAASCGRLAEARAITRSLAAVAVVTESPLLEINLLYAEAVLAPEKDRDLRFREALSRDLARWPWMRACLHLAFGQWLSATSGGGEADMHLDAALTVFTELGADRWARCARVSLANGPRPETTLS